MAIVKYTLKEAKKLKSETNCDEFRKMTDEEIHQAALSDPDAQPLTEEQLSQFTRVVHKGNGLYGHDKSKSNK